MTYLIDTNVLLRLAQPSHIMHQSAVGGIANLKQQQVTLYITPQNLIEFWAVATRPPEVNGLGMSAAEAAQELTQMKGFFPLQPDSPEIFMTWESLVAKYNVLGRQVHDTRLVAVMVAYNISHLLTFNADDFKRFSEVKAIDPRSIA